MPRIKLYINTGFAGAKHVEVIDYDDDEWQTMTEAEKEATLVEMATEYMASHIDYGAYVVEE